MSLTLAPATADSLDEIVATVGRWQHDGGPVQLHPGDLGWQGRFGTRQLADTLWVWSRDGRIVAVGMVDGPGLIRLAISPGVAQDQAVAGRLLADLSDPGQGVLPAGDGVVEARFGPALRHLLRSSGWSADQPWTPLCHALAAAVDGGDLRVEVVDAHNAADRVAVQRASFPGSTFTVQRWRTMAAASPYRHARCLVGYDRAAAAVAAVTVWSAGAGRPGLLEPLGVHPDHRGHGYGRAITLAAAAALQQLGSSTATVCTPTGNVGAVATYVSAGFRQLPDVTDFRRPA